MTFSRNTERPLRANVATRALAFGACALVACHSNATDGPSARESPQASAEPTPLSFGLPTAPSAAPASSAPAPPLLPSLRGDERLESDSLGKEPIGYTLSAALRLADVPGPLRAPEVHGAGVEAARKATELRLAIDLLPTRMRVALGGKGFILPPETEIRARADRFGHVVVWPSSASYRPLAPGALRALLGERRYDVAPITRADITPRDDTGRRIGIYVRRADVTTRAAKATFEIGKLEGVGDGGVLLCRMLLDLISAPPTTPICGADEVPARVEIRWTGHGALTFELTGVLKKTDIATASLLVPPPTTAFAPAPLAVSGVAPLLTPQELGALRTGPVDLAVPAGQSPPTGAGDELAIVNATMQLRVLFVDGVAAAWAAPGARGNVTGLHRGRYTVQWRTFLGDAVEPAAVVVVPGSAQLGVPDGGR